MATYIKKDFVSPNGPILLLSAKGSTTASIAEAGGVKDFSGNGNHGQAYGGVSVVQDSEMGDCYHFNNVSTSRVVIPSIGDTTSDKGYTVSLTIRHGKDSGSSWFICRRNQDNNDILDWQLIFYEGNFWWGVWRSDGTSVAPVESITPYPSPVIGEKHTYGLSVDAENKTAQFYYDGQPYGDLIELTDYPNMNNTQVVVGGPWKSSQSRFACLCDISDIRIYHRALSAAEVKYLHNGFQPNLIMGQTIPSGATLDLSARGLTTAGIAQANGVVDRSGNGNHGQAYNGVAVVNDDEMGSCFSFDGTDDSIKVYSSEFLSQVTSTNALSISLRFRPNSGYNNWCPIAFYADNGTSVGGKELGMLNISRAGDIVFGDRLTKEDSEKTLTVCNLSDLPTECVLTVTLDYSIGQCRVFVNDSLKKEENSWFIGYKNGITALSIGSQREGYRFSGLIKDIRIYPRALTASEVQQLADASLKNITGMTLGNNAIKHIYYGESLVYAKVSNYKKPITEVGFKLNQLNSTSQRNTIEYIAENSDFSSITYYNNTPNLGDWEDWINAHFTPVMLRSNGTVDYELNRDNLNYKADGVTASDISNTSYDGNAMLRIKKFYISCSTSTGTYDIHTIKISDTKKDSSYTCWGFVDDSGNERDYVYYSLFNCYKDSNNKLRSISGVTLSNSLGGNHLMLYDTVVAAAKANGTGWDISNLALENAIGLVLMMLYKNVNPMFVNQSDSNLYRQGASVGKVTGSRSADGGFPYVTSSQTQKALWLENYWRSYESANQSYTWVNGLCSLMTGTGVNDFLPYYKVKGPYTDFTTISNWTPMSSTTPHAYMVDSVSHELKSVMFYSNILFPKDDGVARSGSFSSTALNRYFGGGQISGMNVYSGTQLQYTNKLLPCTTGGINMVDQYCSPPHYLSYNMVGTGVNNNQKYGAGRLIYLPQS